MPNFKGGKKYKSSKHDNSSAECHDVDESQGQMIGRIIRVLGNRNMLLYCNDKVERIAHIRGGLRKKHAKLELGDIVLFSTRGDGMRIAGHSSSDSKERGDILAKYEREVYSQLKKMKNINPRLFTSVETEDFKTRGQGTGDDFGFTFEQEEEEDDDDEDSEEEGDDEERARARNARKMEADKKRSAARSTKMEGGGREVGSDDEVNIDDI